MYWYQKKKLVLKGRILQYSLDLLNGLACISLLNGLVCISLLNGLHLTAKRFGLHLTVKRFGVHLTVKRLCLHNRLTGQAVCQSAISDPFRLITYRIRLKRDIQWNVWSVECETYIKQALKVLIVKQIISFIPISLKSDLSLAPRPLPLQSYRGYQISHILPFTVISWLSDLSHTSLYSHIVAIRSLTYFPLLSYRGYQISHLFPLTDVSRVDAAI
jgi:hypothetical protein